MSFLPPELIPLNSEIQLQVFYPLKYNDTLNPGTYRLTTSPFVAYKNQVPILIPHLYASNVSQLFLSIVKDNLAIDIVVAPPTDREILAWAISFIDEANLEDSYVAYLISNSKIPDSPHNKNRTRETYFRQRFRLYAQRFSLYLSAQYKLELLCRLEEGKINVHIPNVGLGTVQK